MLTRLERTHRLLLTLATARRREGRPYAHLAAQLGAVRRRLAEAERLAASPFRASGH